MKSISSLFSCSNDKPPEMYNSGFYEGASKQAQGGLLNYVWNNMNGGGNNGNNGNNGGGGG